MSLGCKKISISINQLKAGMVIARDIIVEDTVVIAEGVVVTDALIAKLREICLYESLMIYWEEEKPEEIDYKNDIELKEVEESIKKLSSDMEDMFDNFKNSGQTNISEVREFSKNIMNKLQSPRAVIKNIMLSGSGEDCIFKHSVNVATLSLLLGKWLGFDNNKQNLLLYAAILHDFGKNKIDKNILYKKEKLTYNEIQIIKTHPVIAYNLIKDIPYLSTSISYGVVMHHERLDGSGYPLGLKEENIHEFAKVIAIADTFDALNSKRAYRNSTGPFNALKIIQSESIGKLDYHYTKVFIDHMINYYIGEYVLLNNNERYKIIYVDSNNICKPLLSKGDVFLDLKEHPELQIKSLVV